MCVTAIAYLLRWRPGWKKRKARAEEREGEGGGAKEGGKGRWEGVFTACARKRKREREKRETRVMLQDEGCVCTRGLCNKHVGNGKPRVVGPRKMIASSVDWISDLGIYLGRGGGRGVEGKGGGVGVRVRGAASLPVSVFSTV